MAGRPAEAGRSYVYLASSPYSGSTLLSFLLASHPALSTISDVSGRRRAGQMDTFRCSCGERMVDCEFWSRVRAQAAVRGIADLDLADFQLGFDTTHRGPLARIQARSLRWPTLERARDRALAPLGVADAMRDVGVRSWALANAVMDLTATTVFLDASKERLRIRYLERYLPVPPRVIHLVRDVRGVVESTLRRGKRNDPMASIAREWARTNESIEQQLRELPAERQLRIRYEDLCADVRGTLAAAFAFVDLDPEAPLEPIGHHQHMLGNQMRLSAAADVRLDERWRTALSPDDAAAIVRAAQPAFGWLYPDAAAVDGASSRP